jgi:hypothetical protein
MSAKKVSPKARDHVLTAVEMPNQNIYLVLECLGRSQAQRAKQSRPLGETAGCSLCAVPSNAIPTSVAARNRHLLEENTLRPLCPTRSDAQPPR